MIKKLDMIYPLITSYPRNANIISMLSKHPSFQNWLFSNHIQLHISKEHSEDYYWLMFYQPLARVHYPLVERHYLSRNLIKKSKLDVLELTKNSIDSSLYVYTCIDTFFIPAYQQFQRRHMYHDIFIYGYDQFSESLLVADFFKNGKYSFEVTSFRSFLDSFESDFDGTTERDFDIQLLSINYNDNYKLDINFIIEQLIDYLTSANTSKKFKMITEPLQDTEFIFGLNIYHVLLDCLENNKHQNWILKALHVLYDHKILMVERIKFLNKQYPIQNIHLIESFDSIKRISETTRNLYLKWIIKGDDQLIIKVKTNIREIYNNEKESIETLIVTLSSYQE